MSGSYMVSRFSHMATWTPYVEQREWTKWMLGNSRNMNIKTLLLSLTLLVGASASAQHKTGMIFKDGVFVIPTEEDALEQFVGKGNREPALAILTQTLDSRSASALNALADNLVRIMLDDDNPLVRFDARLLLEQAARGIGGGTPYSRMQQTFTTLYEASSDAEVAARNLQSVYVSGRPDYVRNLHASAPKPEKACTIPGPQWSIVTADGIVIEGPEVKEEDFCPYDQNAWCLAGKILVDNKDSAVNEFELRPHCFGDAYYDGTWWERMH